jgi:anthranilate synthase component I
MTSNNNRGPICVVVQGGAALDLVAIARGADADEPALLFQYFEVGTRRLTRSVVGLEMKPLAGRSVSETLEGAASAGSKFPVLLFMGSEYLNGDVVGEGGFPASVALQLQTWLEIDHLTGQALLMSEREVDARSLLDGRLRKGAAARRRQESSTVDTDWVHDVEPSSYFKKVAEVKHALGQDGVHGAVLSIGLSRKTAADPFDIYRCIARSNPSTYGYVLQLGQHALVGCSPLAFMRLSSGRVQLETDAGTRPVTGDPDLDAAAERDLRSNQKDAAEHRVVVDAELESLTAIARDRRVDIPVRQQVRRFSHVMHLYTVLEAELADGLFFAQAIAGLAPAAAVSGHPKRAALKIGSTVEGGPRGPYGGIIGLINPASGSAELAVVIRSLWLSEGRASFRVGGKIVPGSDAAMEHRECLSKAIFLMEGVGCAERREPA